MFEADKNESFSSREEKILSFWKKNEIFKKSLDIRKGKKLFSFYDGPPFATGLPHYGHLLAGTIKDVFPRYKTMKGYYVPRRFGWDCHGLPVENEIEKMKNLSGKKAIEQFGIANFNDECFKIVLRYTQEWEKTVDRIGRFVEFEGAYRTMDLSFMESVWWVFDELYKKGLIYEGFKVMPFSYQLGTPLSNFEANLNYKEVDDPSLTLAFKVLDEDNTYFLAWTTTPWTLVANLALTVGEDIDYVKVKDQKSGKNFILAKGRLPVYFKEGESFEIIANYKGKDLKGRKYEPLLPYFVSEAKKGAFRVITDQFVSLEEGTGIVHTAPAFGEVDFYACKKEGIELVCPVDDNGRYTKEIKEYAGQLVKDAEKAIIKRLKEEGKVVHHGQIRHRYPFCWRSDTPLLHKAVSSWFVAVEKIKDRLIAANEKIKWVPDHIKYGRFGKWLENARDWAISRNRYWGTPIPIWRSEDGDIVVIGSIKELEEKVKTKITNLHRQYIDNLTFEQNGKVYQRIPEVFDCWFESGAMPYAQNHYPFENKAYTEATFPADFIAEGLDQTRGWFYTLNVLSVALFDSEAFKNVIVNGIILAEDGTKMSKRLKNYPEPQKVIDSYGSDAIRLYMINSPAVKAEDLCFSTKGVELILRQFLIPLWNAYYFLSTYASIYNWKPPLKFKKPTSSIDQWIISLNNKLIEEVEGAMEAYDLNKAIDPITLFIDRLTNWYIRRCRPRFWEERDIPDRAEAFETLYQVLLTLSKIIAPFAPFISEALYQGLKREEMEESVHLCDYPTCDTTKRDRKLEEEMGSVLDIVSVGHALRKEQKIKVRQPLKKANIVADDKILKSLEEELGLIADELNVKEVELQKDESLFVNLIAKPNFRVLGKKVGKMMPLVQKEIEKFSQKDLQSLFKGGKKKIEANGESFELTLDDLSIERVQLPGVVAKSEGAFTVAFDLTLSEELIEEGIVRELINKINTMRREANFAICDRISVTIETTAEVKGSFKKFEEHISKEVLAIEWRFESCENGELWDLNGEPTKIEIKRINVT